MPLYFCRVLSFTRVCIVSLMLIFDKVNSAKFYKLCPCLKLSMSGIVLKAETQNAIFGEHGLWDLFCSIPVDKNHATCQNVLSDLHFARKHLLFTWEPSRNGFFKFEALTFEISLGPCSGWKCEFSWIGRVKLNEAVWMSLKSLDFISTDA